MDKRSLCKECQVEAAGEYAMPEPCLRYMYMRCVGCLTPLVKIKRMYRKRKQWDDRLNGTRQSPYKWST